MERILIVEDDLALNAGICFALDSAGYATVGAYNCQKAKEFLFHDKVDLAVLDVNLPDGNGFDLCKEVKEKKPELPVMFLTANDLEEDQIKGFDLQIDDYIPKPISLPLMIRKIQAVLRRYEKTEGVKPEELLYRDIVLSVGNYQVSIKGKVIDLTQKEYEILKELMERPGIVISRESFLNRLWKYEFYGDERAVDNHIKNLRRKLGDAGNYIETVRGVGYRLEKLH